MSSIRFVAAGVLGVLGVCLLTAGCVGPSDVEPVETAEMPIWRRTVVPIGANGLDPAHFWATENRTAFRALGGAALAGAGAVLVATPLLATEGGKSVLDYTVRCALSEDQVVYGPNGDVFYGAFGFAPEWTGRALNTSEQRWVSACIFQHLNGSGEHVDILLRGGHPVLACPHDEEPFLDFIVRDATMYGNAFLPGPIAGFACIDPDLTGELSRISLSCPLDLSLLELDRLCGHLPTCGIAFVGLCDLACTEDAAGNKTCHTLPLLGPILGPLLGASFSETIQTELRDVDLLPLYPGCGLL
ncbi:hypothetical protein WMF04_32290 [Sorangium sp. So ce260]|uniref:hypothetical protein n=1 Tax=Sorangium sp. So ce260 TaxID=3133291 RepID=UPI003F643F9C